MGLIVRTFECDGCGRRFDVYQERDEPPPDGCPFCPQAEAVTISGPVPSTTAIGERRMSKSVDATYRAAEEGSAIRAEALNEPSLKITDMKDNLREGDVAAVTPKPNNVVSQFADGKYTNGQQHSYWGGGPVGGGGSTIDLGMSTQSLVAAARSQRLPGEVSPGASAMAAIQGNRVTGGAGVQNVHPAVRAGAGFAGRRR